MQRNRLYQLYGFHHHLRITQILGVTENIGFMKKFMEQQYHNGVPADLGPADHLPFNGLCMNG